MEQEKNRKLLGAVLTTFKEPECLNDGDILLRVQNRFKVPYKKAQDNFNAALQLGYLEYVRCKACNHGKVHEIIGKVQGDVEPNSALSRLCQELGLTPEKSYCTNCPHKDFLKGGEDYYPAMQMEELIKKYNEG